MRAKYHICKGNIRAVHTKCVALSDSVMPKRRREKHHKHSKSSSEPLEYKLLTYAALGKETKVGKLLAKHTGLDVNFFDAHGNTALHQVNGHAVQLSFTCLHPCRPAEHISLRCCRPVEQATKTL